MGRFGQHSKVTARVGRRDELVDKYLAVAEIQRSNPACEVMFVSIPEEDGNTVLLTEIWSSEEEHTHARESDEVQAWAAGMPELVDGAPDSQRFEPVGGKGVEPPAPVGEGPDLSPPENSAPVELPPPGDGPPSAA